MEYMETDEDEVVSRKKKERKERRRGSSESKKEKDGKKKKKEEREEKEGEAASSGTKRRKIVLASDDDDNDEEPSEAESSSSSSSSSKEGEEEESSSEEEGMMHMRVHAAFAAEQADELPLFMQRKAMSTKEAFELYLEMLARSVADKGFREGMRKNPMSVRYGRYSNAKKKLEDLICTKRESLLGSMQWKLLWVQELRGRPKFEFFDILGKRPDRCQVCGRRRHPCAFEVKLSGPRYDSMALWESRRWEGALPCRLEIFGTPEGDEKGREEGEEEEEEEEEEEGEDPDKPVEGMVGGWWHAGSTCKYKSLCYSSMIHYKFNLLRRVARRLKGFAVTGARSRRGEREREVLRSPVAARKDKKTGLYAVVVPVEELMKEEGWVEAEFERFEKLLSLVENLMMDGGPATSTMTTARQLARLWDDDEEGGGRRGRGRGGGRYKSGGEEESEGEDEEEEEGFSAPVVEGRRGYNPLV